MVDVADDKRTYERFTARFPAKYKHSRYNFGTNVFINNASAGGFGITTKEKLYINDSVSLVVALPDSKGPFILNGEVVWVNAKSPKLWDVGLKFHKVNFMNVRRIYKLAEDNSLN